jgi:hypothetical protein
MPQEKTQAPACARGKREPAHGGEIDSAPVVIKLCDDGHDRATFKRLFHGPERVDGARHLEHHQSIHGKPETIETGTIGRACFDARERILNPEDLPALRLRKRCERERKSCGGTGMNGKSWSNLMQCAKSETAPERIVDRFNA